jgi:hypothetical protein
LKADPERREMLLQRRREVARAKYNEQKKDPNFAKMLRTRAKQNRLKKKLAAMLQIVKGETFRYETNCNSGSD